MRTAASGFKGIDKRSTTVLLATRSRVVALRTVKFEETQARFELDNLPDRNPVLNLIQAFRTSKTMFGAVSLGVFDRLEVGIAEAVTQARELQANTDALVRLLDSCVALGLIKKQGAVYSNLPVARTYLTRSSRNTLAGYILHSDRGPLPALEKPRGGDSRRH